MTKKRKQSERVKAWMDERREGKWEGGKEGGGREGRKEAGRDSLIQSQNFIIVSILRNSEPTENKKNIFFLN